MSDDRGPSILTTALGELPSSWRIVRLGDVFDAKLGKMLSQKAKTETASRPYIRNANVQWGRVDVSDVYEMDFNEDERQRFRLLPGDILVCEGGEPGRTAIWRGDISECYYQKAVHRLRPVENRADPEFFMYHMMNAFQFADYYGVQGTETTIAHLPAVKLKSLPIPLPPLPEQRAIAQMLRTVQRAKEATEKVLAATKQLKQSLLRHLFTYGPVPFDQADQVELKETEIGPMPEHWSLRKLGDVARIGNGSTPKRTNPAYWSGGTVPWLTSGKIHEVTIRQADEFVTPKAQVECHLPVVKAGSVLVAITGQGKTLGNVAQVTFDTCISQHLAYIQFQKADVVPQFILRFLQTRYGHFREVAGGGGSTKGALTCAFLKSYRVPLAPLTEQRTAAQILGALDAKLSAESQRLRSLDALFTTLIHHLMTGKVRVHALDLSAVTEVV